MKDYSTLENKQKQITSSLMRQTEKIEELDKEIGDLIVLLRPVMTNVLENTDLISGPTSEKVALAKLIDDNTEKIDIIIDAIASVIKRCEL